MTGKIFFYILCSIIGMEELKIKEGTRTIRGFQSLKTAIVNFIYINFCYLYSGL